MIGEIVPEVVQELSRGRSRCAGARPRRSRARSAGCGRCIPSSRPSGRRPRSPTSCRSRSTASRPATRPAAIASWRRRRSRCAASTTTWPSSKRPRSCSTPARRQRDHPRRRQEARLRAGLELVEDEGLLAEVAGLVEWPVVLMGAFDEAFLDDPGRGDPRHHPQQPEMLRPARSADGASSPTGSSSVANIEAERRRQGDRRRQRARHPRAAVATRKFFYETDLKTRLEDRLPKFERHRLPREARHAGRAHRAHRAAGGASSRRSSAPMSRRRSARRGSPRPTCSPKWSANSPSCKG